MTKPSFLVLALFSGVTCVVASGATGCARDRVCDNGACEPLADEQDDATSTTRVSDAGERAPADAAVTSRDGAMVPSSDASAAMDAGDFAIICSSDRGCPEGMVCSSQLSRCVMCTVDAHCAAPTPFCTQSGDANDLRCVACTADDHCPTGVCFDNVCQACHPDTNKGCGESTPHCVEHAPDESAPEPVAELACVACSLDEHCEQTPFLTCENGLCVPCELDSNRGCDEPRSTCIEGAIAPSPDAGAAASRRCVECVSNAECPIEVPFCVNDRCAECDPAAGTGCGGEKPFCFAPDQAEPNAAQPEPVAHCRECASNDDCQSAPLTLCVNGTCAECASDADCPDPKASQCDQALNRCVACSTSEQCSHLAETPVCLSASDQEGSSATGRCVQCLATEDGACSAGGEVCQTVPGEQQYQCVPRGAAAGLCHACVADADCAAPAKCVELSFEEEGPLGWFCLVLAGADAGGPATCEDEGRPFSVSLQARSIDGTEGTFCAPHRTCPAYTDYLTPGCEKDSDCGAPGIEDGVCAPHGSSTACTYPCRRELDCPTTVDCTDTLPRVCSF